MQPDYQHFSVSDFLDDDHFIQWRLYPNEVNQRWWNEWLAAHPQKKEILQKAIEQHELLIGFKRIHATEQQRNTTWQHINELIEHPPSEKTNLSVWYWFAAAAAIAAIAVISLFMYQNTNPQQLVIDAGNSNKSILLPDSTVITLNQKSTLKYKPGNEREVWLEGSAYFIVKQVNNPAQKIPFIVHANQLDIQVTGTTFSVVNTPLQCIAVLKEGAIEATAFEQTKKLVPGEKVAVHNNSIDVSKVNANLYNPWTEGSFHFDDTGIEELADIISVFYNRELIIKNKNKLKHKSISGIVTSNDTTTFVKTLEVLLNASIDLKEKEVVITPK